MSTSLRSAGFEIVMKNVFGTPEITLPLYSDDSGPLLKPMPGSQILPENRMYYHHTKIAHDHLAGTNAISFGKRYMKILNRNISDDISIRTEWVDLPDLRLFIEHLLFPANVETLCGTFILSLNPTFMEDYWAFDRNLPTLLKGAPRWLYPGAYKSRGKMLKMIKKWHAFANEHSDFSRTGPNDPEWDPYFGSKYIKVRQQFLHKIELMNADGRASEDLGFLFAYVHFREPWRLLIMLTHGNTRGSSNSIRAGYWTVFEVFARPDLLSHVRKIAQCAHDTSAEEPESVKLGTNPFLQSLFAEVTRLRVVGVLPRLVAGENFQLGEWSIPKGSLVGVPTQIGAMNRNIWNTGTEDDPHPLDKFWGERFLIYPDRPNSGPLRRHESAIVSSEQMLRACSSAPEQASSEPVFSLDGLRGTYLPFGGGATICPGRQFAKQEVLCTLAILVLKYDIELQVPHNWEPKMDYSLFPLGTLPPAEKVPFRIRLRQSVSWSWLVWCGKERKGEDHIYTAPSFPPLLFQHPSTQRDMRAQHTGQAVQQAEFLTGFFLKSMLLGGRGMFLFMSLRNQSSRKPRTDEREALTTGRHRRQ